MLVHVTRPVKEETMVQEEVYLGVCQLGTQKGDRFHLPSKTCLGRLLPGKAKPIAQVVLRKIMDDYEIHIIMRLPPLYLLTKIFRQSTHQQ